MVDGLNRFRRYSSRGSSSFHCRSECDDFVYQAAFANLGEIADHSLNASPSQCRSSFWTVIFNKAGLKVVLAKCGGNVVRLRLSDAIRQDPAFEQGRSDQINITAVKASITLGPNRQLHANLVAFKVRAADRHVTNGKVAFNDSPGPNLRFARTEVYGCDYLRSIAMRAGPIKRLYRHIFPLHRTGTGIRGGAVL